MWTVGRLILTFGNQIGILPGKVTDLRLCGGPAEGQAGYATRLWTLVQAQCPRFKLGGFSSLGERQPSKLF
jgi:hypothetical protein